MLFDVRPLFGILGYARRGQPTGLLRMYLTVLDFYLYLFIYFGIQASVRPPFARKITRY